MRIIDKLTSKRAFGPFISIAAAAAVALVAVVGCVALTGCSTVQTVAPFAVPAATCMILKKEPGAQSYIASASLALRRFSTEDDLDAAGLQRALMGVPIDGVPPYTAQGIFAVVTVAYQALAEKYATDPDKQEKLRVCLIAIADGLAAGVNQCGVQSRAPRGKLTISEDNLQRLAESIANDIRNH